MLELVELGMIENKSWRLPAEGEMELAPREDERVLLLSHVYRGFSLPPHPFFTEITKRCDNPEEPAVKPFRADKPPLNEVWTNWFSPVSNGNPAEEEEGSQEGSVESAEYVFDSGEKEEESEEEEGEDEEQSSPPPPPEPRTKCRHEPSGYLRHFSATPGRRSHGYGQRCHIPASRAPFRGDSSRGRRPEGSGQALVPVLEVIPSATAPAMDAPPTETMPSTETVLIAAKPTGAGLGMPKESPVVPGPSAVQYDARHLPKDQVGAVMEAMVQVELMAGDAKGADDSIASLYKRSLELRDDIRKTCEMGSAYNALKVEKTQVAAQLEAAVHDFAGVKSALAD
ncbi:hypothetical protein ZWY2020_000769 [Hordeum vulgare]|nr:hypothetical protein ZWY2020_000769 [Hordeum vulgare]